MANSLKSYLPVLSSVLGHGGRIDTLYERQRALVRDGLLDAVPGRGQGSGVRANAESVAMLLIGLLGSTNLTGASAAARAISNAVPPKGKCPLTGASKFHDALTALLRDGSIAQRVTAIFISISHGTSQLEYDKAKVSDFVARGASEGLYKTLDGIKLSVEINRHMIRQLSDVVREMEREQSS